MIMFWFASFAQAVETDSFSRLLIEESLPSNEFLSDRKIEIETQFSWNAPINQFSYVTQISVFPTEALQLSVGTPLWSEQNFQAIDLSLYGKYIFVGDENRWNLAVSNGFVQSKQEGAMYTPSLLLTAKTGKQLLQSHWKLGGIRVSGRNGFHLMGTAGLELGSVFIFGQLERAKLGTQSNNWMIGGGQLELERWNIRTRVSSPSLLTPRLDSLRYSLEIEFYPEIGEKFVDSDQDGIWNRSDICPQEKEDHDGFKDDDGCPEADNDFDGILDEEDNCPLQKEDFDGFEDSDGCPEIDNDSDGILDELDRCPEDAEDFNGFRDSDGCPELSSQSDYDGDSLPDHRDKCPYDAEDVDGFKDEDGCPEIDNDHDGTLDSSDENPEQEDPYPR